MKTESLIQSSETANNESEIKSSCQSDNLNWVVDAASRRGKIRK